MYKNKIFTQSWYCIIVTLVMSELNIVITNNFLFRENPFNAMLALLTGN